MTPLPASDGAQDQPVLERLQSLLLDVGDVEQLLVELAGLATTVVDAPVTCGITFEQHGDLLTVGSSDARAEALDETQYRVGDGPCLQSLRTGTVVAVPDQRSEHRWPAYTTAAVELGLRCSLSLPLVLRGAPFGAMNVYGFDAPDLFGPSQRHQLEIFAAQAAGTLWVGSRQVKDSALLAQMEEALRSRTTIDQALGIIMAQQRIPAAAAFELLRRQSQNSRRRLADVAEELVIRTSGAEPEPGRGFDAT